jgi:hypothetical protein
MEQNKMTVKILMDRLNPRVPKKWLLIIAGVMWSGVSILLLSYAITWLTHPFSLINLVFGLLGLGISVAANAYQFSKLARKNINRILQLNDKACVFSFQAWKGYLIIAVMVTGGILLRGSVIPKPYLAIVYAAIGGALLQASINYYVRFFQVLCINQPSNT